MPKKNLRKVKPLKTSPLWTVVIGSKWAGITKFQCPSDSQWQDIRALKMSKKSTPGPSYRGLKEELGHNHPLKLEGYPLWTAATGQIRPKSKIWGQKSQKVNGFDLRTHIPWADEVSWVEKYWSHPVANSKNIISVRRTALSFKILFKLPLKLFWVLFQAALQDLFQALFQTFFHTHSLKILP